MKTEQPPTYEEVIREDQAEQKKGCRSSRSSLPPSPPPRPKIPFPLKTGPPKSKTIDKSIPWVYPVGYFCHKCANTGYKLRNDRPCKICWRRFSPQTTNNTHDVYVRPNDTVTYIAAPVFQPPLPRNRIQPLVLEPGDPRIGGLICNQCNGTGRIRFFLDKELCPICRGVGRVFYPHS